MRMLFIFMSVLFMSIGVHAESPIKVDYSKRVWKKLTKTTTQFVKSIEIKFDKEAAKDITEKSIQKAKEFGNKAIDKMKKDSVKVNPNVSNNSIGGSEVI